MKSSYHNRIASGLKGARRARLQHAHCKTVAALYERRFQASYLYELVSGWLAGVMLLVGVAAADAQLEITYVRHAEGGHNVVYQFVEAGIPTNEWPAYVGKENAFSPKGEAQVTALATKLQNYTFDLIAVSPKWRTRNTIQPYLEATGQKAEIWPELAETGNTDVLPTEGGISPTIWAGKQSIKLATNEVAFFQFRAEPPGLRELMVSNRVEAVACAERVESLLRERFGKKPARVLLVGHGNASRTLVRYLTRQPEARIEHLENTHCWTAREQPDGSFKLDRYNELP